MASGKLDDVDDAILELFQEESARESLVLPPNVVWYNLVEQRNRVQKSSDTIARRMQKLAELGLLEKVDYEGGYYRLTEQGQEYIPGETRLVEIHGVEGGEYQGPFSELEWGLLTQVEKGSTGLDVDDDLFDQEAIQQALNRLLKFGLVEQDEREYILSKRGETALGIQDVYEKYGSEEFFARLAEEEGGDT
ncbi:hypothetical protein [Natronomonas amylolytica]|uniref:hypothetical protein n=1 Tax=Natronomonas amylolytica TaxID=3108498 RepID=UPI00300A2BB2